MTFRKENMLFRYIVFSAAACFFAAAIAGPEAYGTSTNFSSDRKVPAAAKPQENVNKEIDKKMDTAIKVLQAIQEEMRKEPVKPAAQGSLPPTEREALKQNIKEKADLTARVVGKVEKVMSEETGEPVRGAGDSAKELAKNLDKSVDTIASVTEKVSKVMSEYSTRPMISSDNTTLSVTDQLEKTIKVLTAVKEGLKESQEQEKATDTGNVPQPKK
jgi:uncharacterized membrane protein